MQNQKNKDISVFVFKRESQIVPDKLENSSYKLTLELINSMMLEHGTSTPKIGFSGTTEDIAMFIASIIDYKNLYDLGFDTVYTKCDFESDEDISESNDQLE